MSSILILSNISKLLISTVIFSGIFLSKPLTLIFLTFLDNFPPRRTPGELPITFNGMAIETGLSSYTSKKSTCNNFSVTG
jgi:hypothetical protein